MIEDEMVGWHHQCDGHEFEQALEVGDGQGVLMYCSPWGHCKVQFCRGRKGKTTSTEVGYLYSGKEGRQSA